MLRLEVQVLSLALDKYMGAWQSGQLHLTVNQAALCLRRFESCRSHTKNQTAHNLSRLIFGSFMLNFIK